MNTAIQPKDTELHYRQEPHALSRRLDEANGRGLPKRCWLAAGGQVQVLATL